MEMSAIIGFLGIVGDRMWVIWDLVRGGIWGAKQLGGFMGFSVDYFDGDVARLFVIMFFDGTKVVVDEVDVSDWVSVVLGYVVWFEFFVLFGNVEYY